MIKEIAAQIKNHNTILITSHIIPDGDSVGSMLALGLALTALGKEVVMANRDAVPKMYRFLAGSERIVLTTELCELPECLIALDCTGLDRVGEELAEHIRRKRPDTVINIDHHISNNNFGDYNLVDTGAAAAGELVFQLISALGADIDTDIANALYVAIATDTGSFQYESTSASTMEMAARLLDAGVRPGQVNQMLYERRSLTSLQLLAKVLPTLTVTAAGRVAYMTADAVTIRQLGAENEHFEGLVNYPKSLDGVEVALFFRQMEDATVKVAFRSKGNVDVNRVAGAFQGGGHRRAAGCTVAAPLDTAVLKVVAAVEQELA